MYSHQNLQQEKIDLPVGKVVCVGRNYMEHIAELSNPVPSEPLLFCKPATALVGLNQLIDATHAKHPLHYEAELAFLIAEPLTQATQSQVTDAISGMAVALDLTYRDVQTELKAKGHPWEIAKAFDRSCPISGFASIENVDLANIEFQLHINDVLKQSGNTGDMMTSVIDLIVYISNHFTLLPGDVVLTGTPAGVGSLSAGDRLKVSISECMSAEASVV
jgi:2-keto-4-pentenoate hydratase/2-oxohepta-3-ene-1,7-dioic acid hydratase in catechol pathway